MAKLEAMIGLGAVKSEISRLVALAEAERKRRDTGMPTDLTLHLVFAGNPGTGITTVARIVGEIYRDLGLLRRGHVVEVDRAELVAGYIGQTALKTQQKIDEAMDGVLFIDEAYALWKPEFTNDYGSEAIATLWKEMGDRRDRLAVILAGYTEEMKLFIYSNPWLKHGFTRYIHFDDYSVDELVAIFLFFAAEQAMTVDAAAQAAVRVACERMHQAKDRGFGNARAVRTLFERTLENHAARIVATNDPELSEIRVDDIPAPAWQAEEC